MIQLELFDIPEVEKLSRKLDLLERSQTKQRKSQYAQINEAKRLAMETKQRLDILEAAICKQKVSLWD